jgi:hypothetical protein
MRGGWRIMRTYWLFGACLTLFWACSDDDDGTAVAAPETAGSGGTTTSGAGGSGAGGGEAAGGEGGGITCPDLDNVDCAAACANEAAVAMPGTCINEATADCMNVCASLGSPGPIHWGCISLYDNCDEYSQCIAPMPDGCR